MCKNAFGSLSDQVLGSVIHDNNEKEYGYDQMESTLEPPVLDQSDTEEKDALEEDDIDQLDDSSKKLLLEDFKVKLRNGYPVKKHGRSGTKKKRYLRCDSDCTKLTWESTSSKSPKSGSKYEVNLVDVTEIRAGTDADPDYPLYAGTPTLRRSCQPTDANKVLSIIWETRTLDIGLTNPGTCRELLTGLRLLLKEVQREQRKTKTKQLL